MSVLLLSHERTSHRTYTTGRQQNMQRARRYNAAAHKHQQATPCVCDTPNCAVLLLWLKWLCSSEPVRPVIHHLHLCLLLLLLCDRSTLTVDGNVRIVWIKYQYLNCINIHDVLCFFPETHHTNLDIRQHAQNTNITTPPSSTCSSGPHHERVAGPRCTAVTSCSIGGCDPSSVNTASLFCCAVHVCAVCRASRARRET